MTEIIIDSTPVKMKFLQVINTKITWYGSLEKDRKERIANNNFADVHLMDLRLLEEYQILKDLLLNNLTEEEKLQAIDFEINNKE